MSAYGDSWDYEIPHRCVFPISVRGYPDQVSCGNPAAHLVTWRAIEPSNDVQEWVCKEHFDFMLERGKYDR